MLAVGWHGANARSAVRLIPTMIERVDWTWRKSVRSSLNKTLMGQAPGFENNHSANSYWRTVEIHETCFTPSLVGCLSLYKGSEGITPVSERRSTLCSRAVIRGGKRTGEETSPSSPENFHSPGKKHCPPAYLTRAGMYRTRAPSTWLCQRRVELCTDFSSLLETVYYEFCWFLRYVYNR